MSEKLVPRNVVVLHVTTKCTARCQNCGLSCGPDKTNVLSEPLMMRLIDQAAELPDVKAISFSGGEPFIYPELLIKGAQRARQKGLEARFVTNGFWGRWPARKKLDFFQRARPDVIDFSYDEFHRQFVPPKYLEQAIAFTYALGVEAHLTINQLQNSITAQELWEALGPAKHLAGKHSIDMAPYGRARLLPSRHFVSPQKQEEARCLHDSCFGVGTNGHVFPCCRYEGHYGLLALGNAQTTSLAAMVENPVMHLVRLLETVGFAPLVAAARRVQPTLPVNECSNGCVVCNVLFSDVAFIQAYAPLVEQPALAAAMAGYVQELATRGVLRGEDWIQSDPVKAKVAFARPARKIVIS